MGGMEAGFGMQGRKEQPHKPRIGTLEGKETELETLRKKADALGRRIYALENPHLLRKPGTPLDHQGMEAERLEKVRELQQTRKEIVTLEKNIRST